MQYAKAMGFHVIAVDIDDTKVALARQHQRDIQAHESGDIEGRVVMRISDDA